MKVISLYNHKGGVGKTTDALLIGYGFLNKGKKVIFIDLDPQHNLTLSLVTFNQLEREEEIVTAFDLARDQNLDPRPISVNVRKLDGIEATVDVIPSLERDIVQIIRGQVPTNDPFALSHVVEKLKDKYDYMIVDLPPIFLASTHWGLFISDYMIIPISYSDYSQYSSYILLKDILPRIITHKNLKVLGFLLSNVRVNNPEKAVEKVTRDLNDYGAKVLTFNPQLVNYIYRDIVFKTHIPQDMELRDAIRYNADYPPIYEVLRTSNYRPTEKVKNMMLELVDEIEQRINSFTGTSVQTILTSLVQS